MENLHVSLDEAREEIKKRWNNIELRKKIEEELGDKFIKDFKNKPRGVAFKQICQADNGFLFFLYGAMYINTEPLVLEYHDDKFVHFNEEKKGLGRLRVILDDNTRAMIDIINFHENENKKLKECFLKNGESLVNFHQILHGILGYKIDFIENSDWFSSIGKAKDYYYFLLLHFVAHGVLFENLTEGDDIQKKFGNDIMIPEILKIKEKYGLYPLIVRSYPDGQNALEDFFWWCYPPPVNDYIVNYAKKYELPFKKVNL